MQKCIFSLKQWVLQLQNPRSTCGGGHWCRNSEHRSTAETRLPAVDMDLHLLNRSHAEIYFQPWTMGPATPEPPFHLRRWTLVPQLRTPFHRRNSFTGRGHGSAPPKPIPCRNVFSALNNGSCNSRTPVPPAAVDIGAATPNPVPPPKLFAGRSTRVGTPKT